MELKEKIQHMYSEYFQTNEKTPDYACCEIQWHDYPGDFVEVNIALNCDSPSDMDDYIFYYCDGLEGLMSLTEYGSAEDFIVTDCFNFESY